MMEISFIFAYSVFQMVFKSGESVEEEAMGQLPHAPVRRFDKIDEVLNSLVGDDEDIKFDSDNAQDVVFSNE